MGSLITVAILSVALILALSSGADGCDYFKIDKGYLEASGGAAGNLKCATWPSLEAAKQECMKNRGCDGFSWGPWGSGQGGCLKKNREANYNGNTKYAGFHKTIMGCCGGDSFAKGQQCTSGGAAPSERLVSKGKPTKQISEGWGGAPERAVDGNKNAQYFSGSCTHTTNTANPWWQVDLLEPQKVTKVVITNRGDCCWERLSNFVVSVGDKGSVGADPACVKGGKQGRGETKAWPCDLKGRFVTIQIVGTGILTLCEVEVYALV